MTDPSPSTTAPPPPSSSSSSSSPSPWANKYRGAIILDLDPPAALSTSPSAPIAAALMSAFERDYTHLTVLDPASKQLLGYIATPQLRRLLQAGAVRDADPVEKAMVRFQRRGKTYRVITMETRLEELEAFFEGVGGGAGKQEFAVVTDADRRFVLGVVTRGDLEEFARRRPG